MKETIKKIAKEKGLSLSSLAASLLMYKQTFYATISGNPTLKTLEKIASALGVETADLFPKKIQGYLEYNGKIVSIRTIEDLKNVLNELEGKAPNN